MISRRTILKISALTWVGTPAGWVQVSNAATDSSLNRSVELGGVTVEIPRLVDNGNSIPISFEITPPKGIGIKNIEVIAPENPQPVLIKLNLNSFTIPYRFGTRIRLAASQNVWVLAYLTDGKIIAGNASTVLTASACFDGT